MKNYSENNVTAKGSVRKRHYWKENTGKQKKLMVSSMICHHHQIICMEL